MDFGTSVVADTTTRKLPPRKFYKENTLKEEKLHILGSSMRKVTIL